MDRVGIIELSWGKFKQGILQKYLPGIQIKSARATYSDYQRTLIILVEKQERMSHVKPLQDTTKADLNRG